MELFFHMQVRLFVRILTMNEIFITKNSCTFFSIVQRALKDEKFQRPNLAKLRYFSTHFWNKNYHHRYRLDFRWFFQLPYIKGEYLTFIFGQIFSLQFWNHFCPVFLPLKIDPCFDFFTRKKNGENGARVGTKPNIKRMSSRSVKSAPRWV